MGRGGADFLDHYFGFLWNASGAFMNETHQLYFYA